MPRPSAPPSGPQGRGRGRGRGKRSIAPRASVSGPSRPPSVPQGAVLPVARGPPSVNQIKVRTDQECSSMVSAAGFIPHVVGSTNTHEWAAVRRRIDILVCVRYLNNYLARPLKGLLAPGQNTRLTHIYQKMGWQNKTDALLLFDQYDILSDPNDVARLLMQTTTKVGIMRFCAFSEDFGVVHNQVYMAKGSKVRAFADKTNSFQHERVMWPFGRSEIQTTYGNMRWEHKTCSAGASIFIVSMNAAFKTRTIAHPPPAVFKKIEVRGYYSKYLPVKVTRTYLVHIGIYQKYVSHASTSSLSSFNFSSMSMKVNADLSKDAPFMKASGIDCFHQLVSKVRLQTVMAIEFAMRKIAVASLLEGLRYHAPTEFERRNAWKNVLTYEEPSSNIPWALMAKAACAGVIGFGLWWFQDKIPSLATVKEQFVAPPRIDHYLSTFHIHGGKGFFDHATARRLYEENKPFSKASAPVVFGIGATLWNLCRIAINRLFTHHDDYPDFDTQNGHANNPVESAYLNNELSSLPSGVYEYNSTLPFARCNWEKVRACAIDPTVEITIQLNGLAMDPDWLPTFDEIDGPAIYPIIGTNGLLWRPKPGYASLLAALRTRNAVPINPPTRPELWASYSQNFSQYLLGTDSEPLTPGNPREWAESYKDPVKRRKALELCIKYEDSTVDDCMKVVMEAVKRHGLTVFVKSDETLNYKFTENEMGVKPRPIMTIPLKAQYLLQPEIRAATKRLQRILNSKPIQIGDKTIYMRYASGMTDVDLSDWANSLILGSWNGIVMGDDSLLVSPEGVVYEIDYSQYDRCQMSPQIHAELTVLAGLGCSPQVLQLLSTISQARATFSTRGKKRIKIQFKRQGAQRVTGQPNTSLSNSTNNLLALLMFIQGHTWEEIGLVAVLSEHVDLSTATFLKGRFYARPDGTFRWAWLPSAVCKLGKVCSDVDRQEAAIGLAFNMSDGPMDNFPILGAFRRALLRVGGLKQEHVSEKTLRVLESDKAYRPSVSVLSETRSIDRVEALSFIHNRYKISPAEVLEVEALLDKVTGFSIVIHPAFARLRDIDY